MSKECKICGKEFIPVKYSHNQIYCSKRCNKISYYRSPKGQIQAKNSLKRVIFKYHHNKDYRKRWGERCNKYSVYKKGKKNKDSYRKKYKKEIRKL